MADDKTRKGSLFSLFDLLLVVGVLSVLAAVAVPAFLDYADRGGPSSNTTPLSIPPSVAPIESPTQDGAVVEDEEDASSEEATPVE